MSRGKPGKSADFLLKLGKGHGIFLVNEKIHGINCMVPRIFSNRGGQFTGNYSNLRLGKLPDLIMGTMGDWFVVCYIVDPGEVMENMGEVMESMYEP